MLLSGIAIFILGLVPFLVNFLYGDSPFGIDNRGNIAAALGVAFIVVGAARLCWPYSSLIARSAITAYCVTGIFLQVTVGEAWGNAWTIEQQVYGRLLKALPRLSSNETLLLYGFCPYYGPAPIFTESWGLADRLRIDLRLPAAKADTIAWTSEVRPIGLMVMDDWMITNPIPYAGIRIFDVRAGQVSAIRTLGGAQSFFARHPLSQSTGCYFDDYNGVSLY
jgi:hypothetical protein